MKRILIIGSPGAGKSVFARDLSSKLCIPLYHMDNMYWHEDRTHISQDELVRRLDDLLSGEQWIIDGNFLSTMEQRIREADTVFYLDYPTDICLEGITNRIGTKRPDLPFVEEQLDEELFELVKGFEKETKPEIKKILDKYPEKFVYTFFNRDELDEFIRKVID